MSGRREKSEQEKHYENELKQAFAERFKTACRKKFNKNKNSEIGTKELFEIFKHVYPERAPLYLDDKNSAVPTLRKWFNGESIPEYSALVKLCDKECLNCSIDYLFGRIECTKHNIQFIHEYTGLSETVVERLHKFTAYHQGKIRLAVIDFFLKDIHFSYRLTDMINNYFEKYNRYEANKKIFLREDKEQKDLKLDEFLSYTPTVSKRELKEQEDAKEAAHFNVQKEFDNILENLMKCLYDKYSKKTTDAN